MILGAKCKRSVCACMVTMVTAVLIVCLYNKLQKSNQIKLPARYKTQTHRKPEKPQTEFPTIYKSRTSSKRGIQFHLEHNVLRHLKLSWPTRYTVLSNDTLPRFVFGMAVSENHFQESIDTIVSVQRHFPNKTIYYYDIGLKDEQIKKVKMMCNIHYRKFDFDRFPGHARYLRSFAFKSIIIQLLLDEFGAVFYMDASVRMLHNRMDEVYETVLRSDGFAGLSGSSTTVFMVTYPERFVYLPTDVDKLKELMMFAATTILIYKTKTVFENIMYWWVVCSLEQYCGAPFLGRTACTWQKIRKHFSHCDRYDQSTLNILVYNYYNFTTKKFLYVPKRKSVLAISRDTHKLGKQVKHCP